MMSRKICIVTGTRAEYGLLRWVMKGIQQAEDVQLQLVVTGMHLSPEFGLTYQEIEADGFCIDYKVEMLLSADTPTSIAKSIGLGMIGFADALNKLSPDILVVLGDRFEVLAAVSAAMVSNIPIAHIHGGETTEGVIDEAIRHSITKMSHLHFVAAKPYYQRVIQLGEHPQKVFQVGGLGLDNIINQELLSREELEANLSIKFDKKSVLITFHPVTLTLESSVQQMKELLAALGSLEETTLIFTLPNADAGGRALIQLVQAFCLEHAKAKAFTSLGQLRYLSCVKQVDAVIGNSSSALIEVPTLHKGTINIGDRQEGRLKASSVIDCEPKASAILEALNQLYTIEFQKKIRETINPYGEGGASTKVVEVLRNVTLDDMLKKKFYDVEYACE